MARLPRLDGPGLTHHVIHRGNNRQRIFHESADYARYVDLLEEGVARFGHEVLAFCLMPNHVHLVIRTRDVPLSDVVQNAAFRFAAWSNRRLGRVGHVFQGRFRSFLVTRDAYLLALVRYVHQNPVRAGLVASPDQHAWNSHREYLGRGRFPWVRTAPVLTMFDSDPRVARRRFLEWSQADDAEPEHPSEAPTPRPAPAPGSRMAGIRRDVPLERIVSVVAEAFDLSEKAVRQPAARRFTPSTAAVAVLLRECRSQPLAAWARTLGKDESSISRSLRRFETRLQADRSLKLNLDRARERLGLPSHPSDWSTGQA